MKRILMTAILAATVFMLNPAYAAGSPSGQEADGAKMPGMTAQGGHKMSGMADANKPAAAATFSATVSETAPVRAGQSQELVFKLADANGKPLGPEGIKVAHTQLVHLLVIDESLADYQHLHPVADARTGTFSASFTPKTSHRYRVWIDVTPKGAAQSYVPLDLRGAKSCKWRCIDKKPVSRVERDGMVFTLSFESALKAGAPVMGKLEVTKSGAPVTSLEPVMGAFAHIVGFGESGKSVVHIHPMGDEPKTPADRGVAPLSFHIEPEAAGFVKLWAQLKLDGKEIFIPFGLAVKS